MARCSGAGDLRSCFSEIEHFYSNWEVKRYRSDSHDGVLFLYENARGLRLVVTRALVALDEGVLWLHIRDKARTM